MILTEEEAKEKVCPMSFNHPESTLKCYGSKCMWWQPSEGILPRRFEDAPLRDLVTEAEKRRKGYCGMCPPSE